MPYVSRNIGGGIISNKGGRILMNPRNESRPTFIIYLMIKSFLYHGANKGPYFQSTVTRERIWKWLEKSLYVQK